MQFASLMRALLFTFLGQHCATADEGLATLALYFSSCQNDSILAYPPMKSPRDYEVNGKCGLCMECTGKEGLAKQWCPDPNDPNSGSDLIGSVRHNCSHAGEFATLDFFSGPNCSGVPVSQPSCGPHWGSFLRLLVINPTVMIESSVYDTTDCTGPTKEHMHQSFAAVTRDCVSASWKTDLTDVPNYQYMQSYKSAASIQTDYCSKKIKEFSTADCSGQPTKEEKIPKHERPCENSEICEQHSGFSKKIVKRCTCPQPTTGKPDEGPSPELTTGKPYKGPSQPAKPATTAKPAGGPTTAKPSGASAATVSGTTVATVDTCANAAMMATNSDVLKGVKKAVASAAGVSEEQTKVKGAVGGSCPAPSPPSRRMDEDMDTPSRQLSSPQLVATYTISLEAGADPNSVASQITDNKESFQTAVATAITSIPVFANVNVIVMASAPQVTPGSGNQAPSPGPSTSKAVGAQFASVLLLVALSAIFNGNGVCFP